MGETLAAIFGAVVIIVLFSQFPGLFVCTGVAVVVGPIVAVAVWSIRRSDDYLARNAPGGLTAAYLAAANPLRIRFGRAPIWLIPSTDYKYQAWVRQANRLYVEVKDALKHSPVSAVKRSAFGRQAIEVPTNVVNAIWRLMRLHRMSEAIENPRGRSTQNLKDIAQMEHQITQAIEQSLEVLASVPVSLMKVELAHDDIATDRLFAELGETNKRLRDLSSSYADVKQARL